MSQEKKEETVTFILDGQTVTVPKGTTVYHAAIANGIDLPIFCYQDRMPPFGACRVCLVEVEKMPKLQTSCTLAATDGMVVNTQSAIAAQGREEILEFLLINHPLDCPICDRGGECPLQDQTMQFGPEKSRFYEDKRRFPKPIPLGPVLMLDRERCITCARCTRFGDIVAGDHALEFIDRGYRTEVGTPDGAPVESKFIGNTIMICPVGALTSQVYRFRARPWDNTHTESACTLCPVGCSLVIDSRDGEIMRMRSCENKSVNDIWMCDKGWFGYEFADHQERLSKPRIRRNGVLVEASWEEAFALISAKLKDARYSGKVAAWGGNPLTLEENYLFQKLYREGVGSANLDHRVGQPSFKQDEEAVLPGMEIAIGDCENLDYAYLLGLDITEEFPVVWLRLKQAINKGAKVRFIGHFSPEISQHLDMVILHTPGEEIQVLREHLADLPQGRVALFAGRQYLATAKRKSIMKEIYSKRRQGLSINIMEGDENSQGALLAGLRPDKSFFCQKPPAQGLNIEQVLKQAVDSGWDYLHIAGADPAAKLPAKLWEEARAKINFLLVQDPFETETARFADVLLPTLTYVEKEGTLVNIEGRLQKLRPGKQLPEGIFSDGVIFSRIAQQIGYNLNLDKNFLDKLQDERWVAEREDIHAFDSQQGPSSHGGLKATFAKVLFDRGVRMRHNPHVLKLSKEPKARVHPSEASSRGIIDGEVVRVKGNGTAILAAVELDANVAKRTVVLPLGFPELPVKEFGPNLLNGMELELEKLR